MPISFALLLNLVAVASTDDKALLWGFVRRYCPEASPGTHPGLDALLYHAPAYFRVFIAGSLRRRAPSTMETAALEDLDGGWQPAGGCRRRDDPPRSMRSRRRIRSSLRDWFAPHDPARHRPGSRMGSFIALYGIANSRQLIAESLNPSP
jgi:lysyl-tRNA synthetase class 1